MFDYDRVQSRPNGKIVNIELLQQFLTVLGLRHLAEIVLNDLLISESSLLLNELEGGTCIENRSRGRLSIIDTWVSGLRRHDDKSCHGSNRGLTVLQI